MLEMKPLVVGMIETNCYIVTDPETASVWIIDPGAEPERIAAEVRKHLPEPKQATILLTHAHVDHIGAVSKLAAAFHAPVHLCDGDVPLYRSPANALPPFMPAAVDLPDTTPPESNAVFQVIPTPGHTQGGCCYYFPALAMVFTGDTLFAGSVGRTDLPGGNTAQLLESIRTQLLPLPSNLAIAPGHGPESTMGREADTNPYLHFSQY